MKQEKIDLKISQLTNTYNNNKKSYDYDISLYKNYSQLISFKDFENLSGNNTINDYYNYIKNNCETLKNIVEREKFLKYLLDCIDILRNKRSGFTKILKKETISFYGWKEEE